MADDAGTGQGQDSAGQGTGQGQDPAGQGQQTQQQGTQGTGQDSGQGQQQQGQQDNQVNLDAITDPAIRAQVEGALRRAAEANQEAARYRTERNALQQAEEERRRASETEAERIAREAEETKAENERLAAENRSLRIGSQWAAAAAEAKALDPNALLNLVGGPDSITLGEDGKATNLDDLLTKARTDYPWAFSRNAGADAGAGGGAGSAPAGSTPMNDWIRGRR